MAKFYKLPPIDAVQWNAPGDHPAVIESEGKYYIPSAHGDEPVEITPGMFIIDDNRGTFAIRAADFATRYVAV